MQPAIITTDPARPWARPSVVFAAFLAALLGAVLLFSGDSGPVLLVCLVAVAPATVVTMFAARWLAPRGLRAWTPTVLAVVWGAGGAALLAAWGGAWVSDVVVYVDDENVLREAIPSSWVLTPLVEELAKGVGVLAVLLLARRAGLRGVLFGAMVGALVGVGFGWIEDAAAIASDIATNDLGYGIGTWIVRTATAPTHAAFTIWTGAACGLAMAMRRRWARPLIALAGFAVACVAHGAVNHANLTGFGVALLTAFGWVALTAAVAVTARLLLTRPRP